MGANPQVNFRSGVATWNALSPAAATVLHEAPSGGVRHPATALIGGSNALNPNLRSAASDNAPLIRDLNNDVGNLLVHVFDEAPPVCW